MTFARLYNTQTNILKITFKFKIPNSSCTCVSTSMQTSLYSDEVLNNETRHMNCYFSTLSQIFRKLLVYLRENKSSQINDNIITNILMLPFLSTY